MTLLLLLFVVAAAQPNDPHVRLVLLLWAVRVDMDMTHADMTERDRGTDRRMDGQTEGRTAVGAAVSQFVSALRCAVRISAGRARYLGHLFKNIHFFLIPHMPNARKRHTYTHAQGIVKTEQICVTGISKKVKSIGTMSLSFPLSLLSY